MDRSCFDLLTIHHDDLSVPMRLTAPDASVYAERPPVPTDDEKDRGMFDTFPGDLLLARVALPFERLEAIASAPEDSGTILYLSGPDADRCDTADALRHHRSLSTGGPEPTDVPLAHAWVRRGALRAFVVERRTRAMIGLLEQWHDTSWEGLQRLRCLHQQIQKAV